MNNIDKIKNILGMNSDLESVLITPEKAEQLLKFNSNNRKLSNTIVNKYANQMKSNKWHSDASMITFGTSGELTNGQHRLTAIIKSNTPIQFVVSMGVDNFAEMDRGKSRTIVDNLLLDDRFKDLQESKSRSIVGVVTTLSRVIKHESVSSDILASFLDKYKDDFVYLKDEGILFGSQQSNKRALSAAMFVAYINRVDINLLKNVRNVLNTGISKGSTDLPIIALRDFIFKNKGSGFNYDEELYKRSLYCINACERGLTVKRSYLMDDVYTIELE